jgi:O-antigen/teichoic acid export membrane protein
LTLLVLVPFAAVVFVLSPALLTHWVGPEYAAGAEIAMMLTIAAVASTSLWPAVTILQGIGRHRPLAWMALASGLSNLALSLLLVQPFGIRGVALGTLVPTVLEHVCLMLPYTLHALEVDLRSLLREAILPTALPIVPMIALLQISTRTLGTDSLLACLVIGAIGVASYALVYLWLGAGPQEREALQHAGWRLRTTYGRLRPS